MTGWITNDLLKYLDSPHLFTFRVQGVTETGFHDGERSVEQTADEDATFFSVYARDRSGIEACIADLPTRRDGLRLIRHIRKENR